jgi:pimeloyl-ACP methyl ester carboxylesterase
VSQASTPEERAPEYDEFAFLETYAKHEGIPWHGRPPVRRESAAAGDIRLSGLIWGTSTPELIFLHGGGQNAHTWDSVAMALNRPLIAIDLPGHGHSDWREDRDYHPSRSAATVGEWLTQLPPRPRVLVGMSLGGLTSIAVAASRVTELTHLVVVDITPGVARQDRAPEQRPDGVVRLIQGQRTFDSFDEMLQATAALAPNRPIESLRPGVLHNSRQLADGRWSWRYDQAGMAGPRPAAENGESRMEGLWEDLSRVPVPVMLVRGGNSKVVSDDDQAEFERRKPGTRMETVEGAGHSVQSDRPVRLAELITDFTRSGG